MTDPVACATSYCKAVLLPGESLICSDCAEAVAPLIRAAVAAERERICDHVQETIVGWGISRSMYDDLLAAIREEPN